MEDIKKKLVDYFNNRTNNKFIDYDDYIYYQTNQGLSFEKDNSHWTNGQKICVEKKFSYLDKNLKILDVCCGDGRGLTKFKELGFNNVTGVEISDEKINFAKTLGYDIIKRDICSGPFDFGENYDIIYSSHTIEHVLNPEFTIKNIMNSLKEDGTFFLVLPYPDIGAANPNDNHRFKIHCGVVPLGLHVCDNGLTTVNIIKNMGFKVVNVEFDNYRESEIHLTIKK